MNFKYSGIETVAVALSTSANRTTIGNQPNLERRKIVAIGANLQAAKSPNGVNTIGTTAQAAKDKTFVTIRDNKDKERFKDVPLRNLDHTIQNAAQDAMAANPMAPLVLPEPMQLDYRNSYITVADLTAIANGEVVLLTFYYMD